MPPEKNETQLDRIERKLERIDTTLHGTDDEPGKGMVTRIALLESKFGIAQWIVGAIVAAALPAAGYAIVLLVKALQ